jgi:La-related protein 7
MSGQNGNESGHHKTVRKRLQRQLEFYLSASNLRQDKFLQENMDEEGYIAINLFLAFNK